MLFPPELIYVSKLTCKLQRRKQWTGAFGTDVPEADYKPGAVATTVLVTGLSAVSIHASAFGSTLRLSARSYPTWLRENACLNAPLVINEGSKHSFPYGKPARALFTSVHWCHLHECSTC